jgi:hypothetical protein
MSQIPASVNTSLFRFHFLKFTRDVDMSQVPPQVRYTHDVNELIPVFDRDVFVAQGLLPSDHAKFTDAEVLQFVAHICLIDKIQELDPTGMYHHCIIEDKVDLLSNFMTKNLAIINNVPRNYDVAHFYVFPQQSWVFNLGHVYVTLPKLRGACAYTLSPGGVANAREKLTKMTAPYDVMIKNVGLRSYTIYSDMVEHLSPNTDIGDFDDFIGKD